MAVFDFGDAKAFFDSIVRVYNQYKRGFAKSTEDVLFVIMGLNHLREWISPAFNPDRSRKWPDANTNEKNCQGRYMKMIITKSYAHSVMQQSMQTAKLKLTLNSG